ncbi:hypothetical protein ACJIZ3_016848 [Penstemon smallii]|uniref:Uncharacterized protein n=1 Tax=Penstemon smallii TaxID=265156 RepID=A0ABD3SUG4_9LAMI
MIGNDFSSITVVNQLVAVLKIWRLTGHILGLSELGLAFGKVDPYFGVAARTRCVISRATGDLQP